MFKKFIFVIIVMVNQLFATEIVSNTEKGDLVKVEEIKWNSFNKMNADFENKSITKPIFLFVGNSSCKYCLEEISNIRNTKSLVSLLNDKFYVVHVNQDLEEIPMELTVNLTPTMHILNPSSLKKMTPDSIEGLVPIIQLENYLIKIDTAYEYYKKTKTGAKK